MAVVLTLCTLVVRLLLDESLGGRPTLLIFTIPIAISAYAGGLGPGLTATGLSGVAVAYYLLPPINSFAIKDASARWDLMFVLLTGCLISFLTDALHRARTRTIVAMEKNVAAEARTDAALKENDNLRTALDEHAIVAITDARGRITFVNDKFCAISKYPREELLGQDHRLINSGYHSKEFIRNLWTTITRGEVWHGEIRNRAKDGAYYWVDTTIVPFLDANGKPNEYVAIRADITKRKEAEQEIRHLNRELESRVKERTEQLQIANKELESFSYSVSHDLRSPLRAVDGFSQAVLEDYGSTLPEEGQRYLQTIRSGAQRMGVLIDDLLSFARLHRQELKERPVDMNDLARRTVQELKGQEGERVIEVKIDQLPQCIGDAALLKQVWVNLFSNALKYTRKCERTEITIGSFKEEEKLTYFVKDNGTGFDMRYADKLFGVFQRLHRAEDYEGTGVGLAIVQRILHRHGGRVRAESEPGKGATFYFTLESTHEYDHQPR